MKKINQLLILMLLFTGMFYTSCKKKSDTTTPPYVPAEGEWYGSISIYSKAYEDTLKKFLDGDYNRITGSLEIYTSDPTIDYHKYLTNLKTINGSLKLYKAPFSDLSSISSISKVTGDFRISNCPNLTSLIGFTELDTISGKLIIENNPKIRNCEGMEEILHLQALPLQGTICSSHFQVCRMSIRSAAH